MLLFISSKQISFTAQKRRFKMQIEQSRFRIIVNLKSYNSCCFIFNCLLFFSPGRNFAWYWHVAIVIIRNSKSLSRGSMHAFCDTRSWFHVLFRGDHYIHTCCEAFSSKILNACRFHDSNPVLPHERRTHLPNTSLLRWSLQLRSLHLSFNTR